MRLRRPRPPRDRPEWAAALARPRAWTAIGTVGTRWPARVDGLGVVAPAGRGWMLEWCVGAEDRWHIPSREPAVRQRLIDLSPVVETAMRVPSGDVIQRAFGAPGPAGGLAVVELANQSPVPVAIALLIRPVGPPGIERVVLDGDYAVTVDGDVALFLPRRPRRFVTSTFTDGDVADRLGDAEAVAAPPMPCPAGFAQAAVVYPLAHGATLRFALPLAPVRAGNADAPAGRTTNADLPAAAPAAAAIAHADAQAVARGWVAQTRRGMQLTLPEGRLADAVEAARRSLLVSYRAADDPDSVIAALDAYGFHEEVAEMLEADGQPPRARRGPRRSASSPFTEARVAMAELARGDRQALVRLDTLMNSASETFSWPDDDGPASAVFLLLVRDLLVREHNDGLMLCSMLPDSWLGRSLELHDAPTRFGTISFAVRWHGPRPALLWELRPHDHQATVRVGAPGLDPTWSTAEAAGDELLGAPVAGFVE